MARILLLCVFLCRQHDHAQCLHRPNSLQPAKDKEPSVRPEPSVQERQVMVFDKEHNPPPESETKRHSTQQPPQPNSPPLQELLDLQSHQHHPVPHIHRQHVALHDQYERQGGVGYQYDFESLYWHIYFLVCGGVGGVGEESGQAEEVCV